MDCTKFKMLTTQISDFFENEFDTSTGSNIFTSIKNIIDFDNAYIFFIGPEEIELKFATNNTKFNQNDIIKIPSAIKEDILLPVSKILKQNNPLIKFLNLNEKSFIISKLVIKNAVFGFLILCKEAENFYKIDDIELGKAIGSIVSYKIKDLELSDVFKSQIQTLAENMVKIKAADKVKTEFLANISHELRTPLNAIIGFSEILTNGFYGELNTKQTEFVNDIYISGIHLLGMINELLDISKIEAGAMSFNTSKFPVSMAINEVTNIVKPLADKKNIIIIKTIDKEIEINADYQKIKQIMYNLISNAIKFSPENDTISVKLNHINNDFIIEVQDNGIGIAPEFHKKIFDKFVQLENAFNKTENSTGLGLTITKKLVQMHNGSISVKSDANQGATFTVTIPC